MDNPIWSIFISFTDSSQEKDTENPNNDRQRPPLEFDSKGGELLQLIKFLLISFFTGRISIHLKINGHTTMYPGLDSDYVSFCAPIGECLSLIFHKFVTCLTLGNPHFNPNQPIK